MIFADTVVQVDAASLIAALTAFGGAIAGGIVAAARLLIGSVKAMHEDNRKAQSELFRTMNDQWGVLVGLRHSTAKIEQKIGGTDVTPQR